MTIDHHTDPQTAPRPTPRCRARLWELEPPLHLPLLGLCVGPETLRQIAARFAFRAPADDETALLLEAADACRSRNPASEALQRHLEKTFKRWVDRFALLADDAAVRCQWCTCQQTGELAGPLWATCTHRAVSAATRSRAWGDVQLLGCQLGACQIARARQADHLHAENAGLRDALHRQSIAHAAELDTLRTTADRLQRRITELLASRTPAPASPAPRRATHRRATPRASAPCVQPRAEGTPK